MTQIDTTAHQTPLVPAPRSGRHAAPEPPMDRGEDMTVVLPSATGPRATVGLAAVRTVGTALSVSAALWALSFPLGIGADAVLGTVVAIAFQSSMLALLAIMWRTRATGAGKAGRILLGVQAGVLALATVQSLCEALPGAVADTLTVVLDPFWPLSMLGMMITGITVACVGRWRGAARVWTPVATSWIALLPLMVVFSETWGGLVATGHVLVGYVVLGAILALRPDLTRR